MCGIISLQTFFTVRHDPMKKDKMCRIIKEKTNVKELERMEKKKGFSVLKLIITIICIVLIIISVALNIAFSKSSSPKLLGRQIFIVSEENNAIGERLVNGAAILAKDAADVTLAVDDIVLCYPADKPDELCVRSISSIITSDDGSERYYTRDSAHEDNSDSITKDKISAVCTGYPQSLELGQFISFATSGKGIIALLLIPCILLVIFLIAKIASSRNSDEADGGNFDFYEYDEQQPVHTNTAPLYDPAAEAAANNELERKKMSIAENFSQKKVNPDSPYQKEKERTMQFKAQRAGMGNTTSFAAPGTSSSAESAFAARNMGGQSSTAPMADALREEMLRKTAEAERTGTFNIKTTSVTGNPMSPVDAVADNTGILSKSQLAEMSRDDIPKTTPLRSQSAAPSAAPRKSSSPDISDILSKSESLELKKTPSKMSVDDLLKMIEDEKSRL